MPDIFLRRSKRSNNEMKGDDSQGFLSFLTRKLPVTEKAFTDGRPEKPPRSLRHGGHEDAV